MPWKDKEKKRAYNREYARRRCLSGKQLEYERAWRAANPETKRVAVRRWRASNHGKLRESDRRSKLKKAYGITPEQYDQMLESQSGCCAICSSRPNGSRLHVDHCHNSKRVRGLLCSNCNTMLGLAGEDPARLINAVFYITPNVQTPKSSAPVR